MIYIIFGASGSGKTTLLRELEFLKTEITLHKKAVTRPLREYDGNEVEHRKILLPNEYDYVYEQYGNRYGLQKKQIEDSINKGIDHFIICNDVATIQHIKSDFEHQVFVIYLLFDAPLDTIEQIQKLRGIKDDEAKLRIEKIENLNKIFIENRVLFNGVIVNHFGAPTSDMIRQLERIMIPKRNTFYEDDINFIRAEIANLSGNIQSLLKGGYLESNNISVEKGYAFVVMAMGESEETFTEDVLAAIKRSCEGLNIRAERIDDVVHNNRSTISAKILGSIKIAQCVIIDLSYPKPNVYFEFGYAQALDKHIIPIAKQGTSLPFDVSHYKVSFYKNISELERLLSERLEKELHSITSVNVGENAE